LLTPIPFAIRNVQEVNGTGRGIWVFVVTSLAMLGISVLSWFLWRAGRNWQLLFRYTAIEYGTFHKKSLVGKLSLVDTHLFITTGMLALRKKMPYYLGVRTVEKLNIGQKI